MEDNPNKANPGDPGKLPQSDRNSDSYVNNPGLKDEERTKGKNDKDGARNEDKMEEKEAIEDTSEDRLSEAE